MGWSDHRAFRSWLLEQRYATATVDVYVRYAVRCHELLAGDPTLKPMRRAGVDEIETFLATLPATAPSWNLARKALSAYFRYAGRRPNPADEVRSIPEPHRLPRPLSADGHARFVDATRELGGVHEVVGLLLATTACRFTELQRARWTQFDLGPGDALWRISGKGSGRRGPKPRLVPIHSAVAPVLRKWRAAVAPADWLFPGGSRDGHVSPTALRATFREICDVAGLDDVVPHMLRHTVATLTLEARRDLREVQELLGHASMSSTQGYTQVLPSRLREAVEALPV